MGDLNKQQGAAPPRLAFIRRALARSGLACASKGMHSLARGCSLALDAGLGGLWTLCRAWACLAMLSVQRFSAKRPSAVAAAALAACALLGSAIPWSARSLRSPSWDGRWLVEASLLSRCQSPSGDMRGGCAIEQDLGRIYLARALGSEAASEIANGAQARSLPASCMISVEGPALGPDWAGKEAPGSSQWGSGPAPWLGAALRPLPGAWRLGYDPHGRELCPPQSAIFWTEGDWQAWMLWSCLCIAAGMLCCLLGAEALRSAKERAEDGSGMAGLEAAELSAIAAGEPAAPGRRGRL